MTQTLTGRPAVSVDELKRAWAAVQSGDFRARANTIRRAPTQDTLVPGGVPTPRQPGANEVVVPVLGCGGSTGATTLAVALATAAGATARVVECASVTASGLGAASTAELGSYQSSWLRGTRGHVLLERVSDVLTTVEEIPYPSTPDRAIELTILDIGWEIGQVLTSPGWIGDAVRNADHVVLTTTATVPGMRRLDCALDLLAGTRACAAVLGPGRKKWAKSVRHTSGHAVHQLNGDLFEIPEDRALAVDGLTGTALPKELLRAAHHLAQHLLGATKGTSQ